MIVFHLFYKTAAGHGTRGDNVKANTIEEAFEIARERDQHIWLKAKDKEFYVTPASYDSGKVYSSSGEKIWLYPDQYPFYCTYGVGGGLDEKSKAIQYYQSKHFTNIEKLNKARF